MAIFKCKMCGGDLEVSGNETVAVCEYCGTKQTLPRLDDDKRANLYDRANHFRRANDFDKAAGIYEQILNEDRTDAEAYWSLVLCKYGIEYVEDPASHKRLPTVNRAQYTSILADEDYKSALQYADAAQREVYEAEAHAIDEIQKGILAISQQEEPFDVFICYKETDANGRRTPDSVLATELYHGLTQEGLKVFFARITLEDKLGTAYEPYIFAALNSARVMVVLGTRPEYFNAVWVKNEWSRYLGLIKNGAKKTLIPAYRDMDPYDLPDEFSHLQAQDMAKLGFMQDLIRGVKKILGANEPKPAAPQQVVVQQSGGNVEALLERAYLFLDEGDFDGADEYCEKVLDQDAKNVRAYLGKLLAARRVCRQEDLKNCARPFDDTAEYKRVLRFADEALKAELEGYNASIRERNEQKQLQNQYNVAAQAMHSARTEAEFKAAAEKFKAVRSFKDAAEQAKRCLERAENCRRDAIFRKASDLLRSAATVQQCEEAIHTFESIHGWRDADAEKQIEAAREKIEEIKAREEAARKEKEAQEQAAREKAAKNKKIGIAVAVLAVIAIAAVFVVTQVVIPNSRYNKAAAMLEAGDYDGAAAAFEALGDYKDSAEQANAAAYAKARELLATEDYDEAIEAFEALGDYKDSAEQLKAAAYSNADALLAEGDKLGAAKAFGEIRDYSDAWERCFDLWGEITERNTIAAGRNHTVGLRSDGTVVATGDNDYGQCDVSDWTDIVAVATGEDHTVGLRSDGTVVATGDNLTRQCVVSDWTDIVAVSAGHSHTVGLKSDGTVVAVGNNSNGQCDVSGWADIVAIAAGYEHTVGLRSDGTVVAVGWNRYYQCDVSGWTDIVAVSAGDSHTVGLKSDGTVVAAGSMFNSGCDVSDWTDIVAVAAGYDYTVGLRSDGTVAATEYEHTDTFYHGQCDVDEWTDIVAVAGYNHTVGLRSDGTVVAVGDNAFGQCDVSGWTDIKLPNT